jgi:hypothetical protein
MIPVCPLGIKVKVDFNLTTIMEERSEAAKARVKGYDTY